MIGSEARGLKGRGHIGQNEEGITQENIERIIESNFMKINELIQFFGLPPESKNFDTYLSNNGILDRPKFTSSPVESIDWEEGGLSLVFETMNGYQESWGKAREPGVFIFSSLQAYGADNDSGFRSFQGELPFNLTFNTTLAAARKIFGDPTVNHKSGQNHIYVWYGYHKNTISLCFLPDNKGISFFDIAKDMLEPPL